MAKKGPKEKAVQLDALSELGISGVITPESYVVQEYLPTGFSAFDRQLLGGGILVGKLVQIWGPEASGKSAFCRHLIAQAQRQWPDQKVLYYSSEFDYDQQQFEDAGVDLSRLYVVAKNDTPEVCADILKVAKSGKVKAIFLDSVGNLFSEDAVGKFAREMTKFSQELVSIMYKLQLCVVFTNQQRDKIGGFSAFGADNTTYPGGKNFKHNIQQSLKIKRVDWLPDFKAEVKEGIKIGVTVDKHKLFGVGKTDDTTHLMLYFKNGLEKAEAYSLFDDAIRLGLLQPSGAWFKLYNADGEQVNQWQGRDNARAAFLNDSELRESVKHEIRCAGGDIPQAIISESEVPELSEEEEDFSSDS